MKFLLILFAALFILAFILDPFTAFISLSIYIALIYFLRKFLFYVFPEYKEKKG